MKRSLIILITLLIPINIKAISTSAESAILMDMDSKRILYAENINKKRSVASISKIMTAYIAVESGKLKEKVKIGDEIDKSYGSGIYIKKGEVLTLEDLLYGLMLRSGNDASLSIAKYVGGSVDNFVSMMNKKTKNLKLLNTTFNNPNGLDEENGNYSTAYDMAIIMSEAYKNKDLRRIISTKVYKLTTNKNSYVWHNKNKLLKMYKYTTGGKTGYTKKAKRTLVNTASKKGLNLVVVTLNDGDDFNDHKKLFEYGFNNYKNYHILKKGIINIVDDNYYDKYNFYIKNDYYYPLSKEEKDSIIIKYKLKKIRFPKNNQEVGNVIVYFGEKKLKEEKIYIKIAKENKNKKWFKIHDK